MKILGWMITRMLLVRFLMILLGIAIFVATLEAVTYSKDIIAVRPGVNSIFIYGLLRLPSVISTFLPLSVLLATLLTFMELSYRNEMPPIWATGQSPFMLMRLLLPVGLFIGGLNFLINDQAVPRAAPVLYQWGIGDYSQKKIKIGENDPLWMRAGNDIVRAGGSNPDSTVLSDVVIFRRDDAGLLTEQIHAARAELKEGRWRLPNATVYSRENLPPSRVPEYIYSGQMRPAKAGNRSGEPEEMTLATLAYFVENQGFGIRPTHVYRTWWNRRLSLLATSFLMICLCVPLASRFRRGGGIGIFFAVGVALGWGYFILEGIALTMGEVGFVPSWMAVWFPVAGLAALVTGLALNAETL